MQVFPLLSSIDFPIQGKKKIVAVTVKNNFVVSHLIVPTYGVFPIVPLFEITGKKVRKSVGQSGICF
jgi:hypothetical protein